MSDANFRRSVGNRDTFALFRDSDNGRILTDEDRRGCDVDRSTVAADWLSSMRCRACGPCNSSVAGCVTSLPGTSADAVSAPSNNQQTLPTGIVNNRVMVEPRTAGTIATIVKGERAGRYLCGIY